MSLRAIFYICRPRCDRFMMIVLLFVMFSTAFTVVFYKRIKLNDFYHVYTEGKDSLPIKSYYNTTYNRMINEENNGVEFLTRSENLGQCIRSGYYAYYKKSGWMMYVINYHNHLERLYVYGKTKPVLNKFLNSMPYGYEYNALRGIRENTKDHVFKFKNSLKIYSISRYQGYDDKLFQVTIFLFFYLISINIITARIFVGKIIDGRSFDMIKLRKIYSGNPARFSFATRLVCFIYCSVVNILIVALLITSKKFSISTYLRLILLLSANTINTITYTGLVSSRRSLIRFIGVFYILTNYLSALCVTMYQFDSIFLNLHPNISIYRMISHTLNHAPPSRLYKLRRLDIVYASIVSFSQISIFLIEFIFSSSISDILKNIYNFSFYIDDKIGSISKRLNKNGDKIVTDIRNHSITLEITDLDFKYPPIHYNNGYYNDVFSNLNLKLHGPSIVTIYGPRAIGKSTLLYNIIKLKYPVKGNISINSINFNSIDYSKHVNYCLQQEFFYCERTTYENLVFFNMVKGLSYFESKKRAIKVLKQFGLYEYKDKISDHLTNYQKRILSIAISTLGNPSVICLDEPTSGLYQDDIEKIRKYITELGRTKLVILTTSSMAEAKHFNGQLIVLKDNFKVEHNTYSTLEKKYHSEINLKVELYDDITTKDLVETALNYLKSILPGALDIYYQSEKLLHLNYIGDNHDVVNAYITINKSNKLLIKSIDFIQSHLDVLYP